MTHFNLNRMLQGCSAFIQTMAGDRAARNGAKRVNNHVLPLTCPLLASSLRLTCPLQLRRIALILCVSVLSVGQMWGAETVLFSSFANTTASNYFKSYTVDGKTVTVAASSTTISSSSGDNFCAMMQGTPTGNNDKYVELTVTGATIKTVSVLITGNGENKTCQPALLGWEGAIASNTTADYVLVPASQVISNKGVANAKWHQFDVHGNDLTRVRIYRAVKGVNVAGESTSGTTYGNAQSLQFYGIRVELESGGSGGGAYPEGYIYITDVKATPETGASGVTATGGSYDNSLDGSFSHDGYTKWFQTSGASGYYQLNFSPALDVSSYTDLKVDLWWGVNAGSNRATTVYVNGTSVGTMQVDSKTRYQVLELSDLAVTATSISSIKIEGGGGGANSVFFRVGIKGTPAASTCTDKYSFHYGPASGDWETPICFEQVGSTHEWNITNFAIPDHTNGQFWVGHHGETNSQSQTKAWTDSYSDGNGAMKLLPTSSSIVGQAIGAVGTINIWDDSGWKNQNVGFTPNGYGITYGGSGHAFHTTATAHMLETDVVTLPDVSTTYTMGLATATPGTYVICAHSSAAEAISAMGVTNVGGGKKAIYLVPGSFNVLGTEKYAIYDKTADAFSSDFMKDDDGDGIYVGYVSSGCTSIILVRMSADATTSELASKDWTHKWNQTTGSGIAISGDLAKKYTITKLDGDNCSYSTANMQPITGQKGKFRMWDDSGSSNWYVHFIPYYVLSYNANGGSGTTAATERNSESSTLTVSVASNGFTAPTGYQFDHWDTAADGSGTDYAPGATYNLTADATLYAIWTPKTINITLAKGDHGAENKSATVKYDATALTSITHVTPNTGYTLTGYYDGETKVLNANGTFAAATVSGYITSSKWTKATDCTLTAKWECVSLTVNLGGDAATPAGGSPIGTEYTLTCSASTGVIASYQWKQNTTASTAGAVNAVGTGATTASFNPNPAAAGTYYYYCVATDACGNTENTSFSGEFQFNAAAYTVTYNKNGDGAGGAGSVTGTVPSDATAYSSGQRPVVKGPGDLAWDGHTFIGWNDKADGSGTYYSEKANFAISASKTLYAQWRTASSCPGSAGGTVFSLSMNNNTSSAIAFNYGESKLLSSYATIQRGDASFTDIRTSNSPEGTKATITKASPAKLKIEGNDVTIMLFLDCALQQGDVLTFTETNNRQLYITTTPSRATTIPTTSNSYTIPAESPLIGKRVIYLWRNSSTYNIDAITITRPASVSTYTVTYNANGGTGSDVVDDAATTISDVPGTFTAPGAKHFMNWNTIAGGTGTTYEVGDAVTSDLTLYAQWRWQLSYDANAGGDPVSNMPEAELHNPGTYTLSTKVPTRAGYTFGGWYRNSACTGDSFTAGASFTTGDLNETLYAKWTEDECTPTTLFSMVVNPSAADYSLAKSTTKTSADSEISGRLTSISGGTFSTENTSTSSSKDIFKNNCLKVSSADVYYSIALSGGNTLQAGDIITITTKTAYAPYITSSTTKASNPTMAMSGSSDPYTYTLTLGNTNSASGKDIIGAGTLYLWKNSSDVYIHSITITRPCAETCTTPTIAWSTTPVNGAEGGNMNATVTTNYATGVTYTTSNSSIVSVSGNGTTTCAITYGSAGTARVTATVTGDGSDYCTGPVSISIDITVSAAAGDCEELAHTAAASATTLNTTVGTASLSSPSSQSTNDGAIKLGSSGYIELTPKAGKSFAAGDSLIVVIYNQATKAKTTGFNIGDDEYTASIAKQSNNTFRQKLTAANIKSGKVKIERHDSDGWFVSIIIKHCDDCTMPSISAHPSSATYTKGDSPTALSITATNTTSYQWFSNEENANTGGNSISGATSASYTPSAAITGTTYYYCEATNACGTVASNTATITVNSDLPTPKAVWTGTTTSPNYGGGGYAVVVEANKNDDSDWDGTLEASMLTASTGITLRDITVNNTDKKITATYDVTQTATSPITFTLSLPETATQGQADLTYDVAFSTCAGSGGEAAWHYFFTNAADATANSVSNDAIVFTEVPSSTGTAGSNFSFTIDGKTFASMKYGYKGQTSQGTAMGTLVVPSGYQAISFVAVVNAGGNGLNMKLYQEDTEKASTGNITNGDGNIGTISATLPAGSYTIKPTGRDCARLYAYAVKLQEIGGGNINTALVWSNSQASGARVDKNEGDPGFVITANRSGDAANTSLGVISYVSSDESVATVNATTGRVTIEDDIDFGAAEYKETTITATLAASGCYKRAQITYVLRVTKHECPDVAGTIVSVDNGCSGVTMTISGYTEGATIQWYKDDVVITGETGTSYTATTNGNYYAKTTVAGEGHCTLASTNSIDVTMAATTSTKLIDEWYVKNERRTPDIALVQTNNAAGWSVSPTTLGGCGFYLGDDGIIYLKGTQDDGSAPDGLTDGDQTITVTVNACGGGSTNHTITIHKQAATVIPSIAFVVDGTKGGTIDAVEAAKTTERAIWTYLADYFSLTACNAYWTTEEKKLRQYYSQFDAIVITDDPSTYTKSSSEPKIEYIKAMGGMVDIRPLLTMEAFVGRYGEGGWGVYNASPESPNPRQYTMRLQCKEHTIYKDLVEGTNVVKTTIAGVDYWDVTMVDKTLAPYATAKESEYATKPALQGFDANKFNGMLGIGTIAKGTLQGGVERQKEAAARMMILGIQNQAMDALTPEGKQIVKNAIEYLLLTDMDDIEDCSNYFHGQGGTNTAWSTPANWSSGKVPDATTKARLLAPCEVSGEAVASSIEIVTGGKTTRYKSGASNCEGHLTINASGILNVDGTIRRVASAPNFGDVSNTRPSDLLLESNSSQTGALIHNQTDNAIGATIELQSKAYSEKVTTDGVTKKKKYWQYVGLPVQNALAEEAFWGAYTYLYDETSGWIKKRTGDNLQEFWGIGLSSDVDELGSSPKFSIAGDLALATDRDIELTKTAGKGKGENLIGNSWTAPIHLVNMTDEDFEGAIATVYIFNTGRSETTPTYGAGDLGTAGQWRTIPVGTSRLPEWKGPKVIPAMQAFQVNVDDESSSGTLHLNYEKHVRSIETSTEENNALMAPQRYKAATPSMLRLRVADSTTYTDLYLIEGDQFSDEFDNGWEGQYMPCDGRSAKLCALNSTNEEMAVLAQQSINNTSVVFAPGRDTEYTFTFGYDGDVTYYLNDIQLEKSTEIREGNEYHFTSNEGDLSIRFVVSTTPYGSPSVTTGTGIAGEAEKAHKVIYNKHVYIIRGGRMYDVVGKTVR